MADEVLLMVLIDAFRADYLERAPFLRSVARSGAVGRLREPFGFCPRAAYFGGLSPSQTGFTNMMWYDPDHSVFAPARHLGAAARALPQSRRLIEREVRRVLPPFAAAYASTLDMPLQHLPFFDVTERMAPWDKKAGYRSLFHIADDLGLPWYQCSWPLSNLLPDSGDDAILAETLTHLDGAVRLAFVHFNELDHVGHRHGPGAVEVDDEILRMDARMRALFDHCAARYDTVSAMIFGDHGMVNVLADLDVWSALAAAGLSYGNDYVAFFDSTMARFWFLRPLARTKAQAVLAGLRGGRVLDQAELDRLEVSGCDPRNGELYFLADPGWIILPNHFQAGGGRHVRGMHGYHPDEVDNQGLLLVTAPGWRGELGVVEAPHLFHTALDLLAVDDPALDRTLSARARLSPATHGAFVRGKPEADAVVAGHLRHIAARLAAEVPEYRASLVCGSFGRGEGSVLCRDGAIHPLNDYDILVVADTVPDGQRLRRLGRELAAELGLHEVDLGGCRPQDISDLPNTLLNYDIVHGSVLLDGDPAILATFPRLHAARISVIDMLQLLLNRCAGLLLSLREREDDLFANLQVNKALMAVGDWHLLRWQAYDVSYRTRRRRFASLAAAVERLEADDIAIIDRAYGFRFDPAPVEGGALDAARCDAARIMAATLVMALEGERRPGRSLDVLLEGAADRYPQLRTHFACAALALGLILDRPALAALAGGLGQVGGLDQVGGGAADDLILVLTTQWERLCH